MSYPKCRCQDGQQYILNRTLSTVRMAMVEAITWKISNTYQLLLLNDTILYLSYGCLNGVLLCLARSQIGKIEKGNGRLPRTYKSILCKCLQRLWLCTLTRFMADHQGLPYLQINPTTLKVKVNRVWISICCQSTSVLVDVYIKIRKKNCSMFAFIIS